ncbi:MAG: HlyD family secretion protein [Peptococcaceae bacterium]
MAEEAKNIKKKRMIGVGIIAVIITISGFTWWWFFAKSIVSTDNAKVNGDLVDISAEVSGKLIQLNAVEGQQVQAGQILAKLDDSQYKINLQQAQAALDLAQANYAKLPDDIKAAASMVDQTNNNLSAAQAQLKSAQIALADVKRSLDHARSLFAAGAISQEAMDTAQSNYDKAESGVEQLNAVVRSNEAGLINAQAKLDSLNNSQAAVYQAQLDQAQAAYNTAKRAEDKTTVIADTSGTILRIPVTVGETLAVNQTILTTCNLDAVWIEANIDEDKAGRIKEGQKVDVRIDNYPGVSFYGSITAVKNSSQAIFALIPTENTSGNYTKVTQRIPVKIKVENNGYVLKPGLSSMVKIHITK